MSGMRIDLFRLSRQIDRTGTASERKTTGIDRKVTMQNEDRNKLPLTPDEKTIVAAALGQVYDEILKTRISEMQARMAIGRAADHLYTASDKKYILDTFNDSIQRRSRN